MPILREVVYHKAIKAFELRYFALESEVEKARGKYPHIRPDSVLVCSIGNRWKTSAWQRVVDMVEYTNQKGVCCWLFEVPDRMVELPYHALQSMRDFACIHAHNLGFEWVVLVDNDILPEPDLLLRLLRWDTSVVVPFMRDNENHKALADPHHELNTGLKPVWWSVNTCLLIRTKVLNCFPDCMPFGTINLEYGFYEKLIHYGHRAYQDTNTELLILTSPSYPALRSNLKGQWKGWEKADVERRKEPNRRPIDSNDKRKIYLPGRLKMGEKG